MFGFIKRIQEARIKRKAKELALYTHKTIRWPNTFPSNPEEVVVFKEIQTKVQQNAVSRGLTPSPSYDPFLNNPATYMTAPLMYSEAVSNCSSSSYDSGSSSSSDSGSSSGGCD